MSCVTGGSSETAYSLLQGRPELQSQQGQFPWNQNNLLQLSQLGKDNSFAKNYSVREAGEMSPAPGCHSLQLVQGRVFALEVTCLKGGGEIIIFTEFMLSLFCCQGQ